MTASDKSPTTPPYGSAILIRACRRTGLIYWRRYLLAFALMGFAAATTAGSAYLLGEVITRPMLTMTSAHRTLSLVTILIFVLKGAATYGHQVILWQSQRHPCQNPTQGRRCSLN